MGEPVDHGSGRPEDGRTARAARVLAVLRDLWGDEPPPGQDPDLAWLVDALAVDDAHGREHGYVVRGDAITLTSLAHWLTSPPFPDEQTGAWQWDSATGRVQLDELAGRVLGVGGGPVGFPRLLRDVHPDDRAGVGRAVQRAATTGEPFHLTFRGRSPQGEWVWRTSAGRRVAATDTGTVLVGFVTAHRSALPVE